MKNIKFISTVIVALLFLITGCRYFDGVKGNGNYISESRSVGEFNILDVSGAFTVYVEFGDKTNLEIITDENLHQLIKTDIKDDKLIIDQKKNMRSKEPIEIRIKTKELIEFVGSGACEFYVNGIYGSDLNLDISGASNLFINGKIEKYTAEISGASKLFASDLISEYVKLKASGASKAEVFAEKTLKVNGSGASKINYLGDPDDLDYKISGASSINRK